MNDCDGDCQPPLLVASTGETFGCSIAESSCRETGLCQEKTCISQRSVCDNDAESNYFKSLAFVADGTSLISSSADNKTRTFILPPSLLEIQETPPLLTAYTVHTHPTSVNAVTSAPYYELSDPSTTHYLCTPNSLPIRLLNALSPSSTPLATYLLVCPNTEAYLTPASISWCAPGTHFLTGTDSLIAQFDVSRPGSGPVSRMPTIPSKRHKIKGGGVGMRGIVSSLSVQKTSSGEGMLAAGTWTRWVGLYDAEGLGGTVAAWSVNDAADKVTGIGGKGVSETKWSACGRYLCVAERGSDGVLVYDVRITGKVVSWLSGRKAKTNQRLYLDVFETSAGFEVWAGGTDGVVRVWDKVGMSEGMHTCSREWQLHEGESEQASMLHTDFSRSSYCYCRTSDWHGLCDSLRSALSVKE